MSRQGVHPDKSSDHHRAALAAASGPGALLAYCGDRRSEHFGPDGGPHCTDVYASDTSGTKTYLFNGSGFRGESIDPSARMRVFVCGASYAFGTGLDWEETWGYRLKAGLAEDLGTRPAAINVLNFSQSLASANYVTRTLLAQCDNIRPDLVIAVYSDMKRAEYFLDGEPVGTVPYRYGWLRRLKALRPGWRQRLMRWLPDPASRREADRRLRLWHAFGSLYSREYGVVNTLTNILLLQSFCRARGIDCLISWVQHQRLDDASLRSNPAVAPLIDLLDPDCFCPFSIVDDGICTDLAADGIHPGAASNRAFAAKLIEMHRNRLSNELRTPGASQTASADPARRARTG